MEVYALAAEEQDPDKLLELTKEIVRLLDEKESASRTADFQLESWGVFLGPSC